MTNVPSRVGDRYLCFIVTQTARGWGGPWGQNYRGAIWECEECGYQLREYSPTGWDRVRAAEHHEHGHAPCEHCGQLLLKRKDGTPRQHAYNKCPGKNGGFKIEREFVKNMTGREMR